MCQSSFNGLALLSSPYPAPVVPPGLTPKYLGSLGSFFGWKRISQVKRILLSLAWFSNVP